MRRSRLGNRTAPICLVDVYMSRRDLTLLKRFRKARNKASHEEALLPGISEEIYRELVHEWLREFCAGLMWVDTSIGEETVAPS